MYSINVSLNQATVPGLVMHGSVSNECILLAFRKICFHFSWMNYPEKSIENITAVLTQTFEVSLTILKIKDC